jgi:GTP cyclohydrolase I
MQEFEAQWIDRFIQIVHQHRDNIGSVYLTRNIADYQKVFKASSVRIDFEYPFFVEKLTPVSKEKCLFKVDCVYSAKVPSIENRPKVIFKIDVPVITTDPSSKAAEPGGLFGQLSIISIEIEPHKEIFPEDIIDVVDKCALSPAYSFLMPEDQLAIIQKVHTEEKSSVMVVDDISSELTQNPDITWFSIKAYNHSLLHTYNTFIGTEQTLLRP